MSFLLLLTLLPLSINAAGTVECHNSIEGSCTVDAIFGFCYHNKKTGEFNCDDSGYCARKIQGTKQAGCYKEGNSTTNDHCCCNTGNGCSIGFGTVKGQAKATTTCTYHIENPDDKEDVKYNDCEDPFCYTFMSSVDNGVTSVWRGCMATTIVRYNMYKMEDKLYKNNSKWESLQYLIDMPRCEDVVSDEEYRNGTELSEVSKCVEYEEILYDVGSLTIRRSIIYSQDDENESTKKKRLCCCKGKSKCNDEFGWNSPAITLDQAIANKEQRKEGITVVDGSMESNIFLSFFALIFFYILN
ncbi:mtd-1 [Pristionchus pacificus]|uniref:Mtd-1 n=1 Tax=Pristionchus pacificus TaxID=54126 RepID=A0A2A6CBZ1_PRIPA|nr:mtd-1 [Pristionchus pacificus]|eukprot:PDM75694.1 mtd-1 [Pristionchus pacificus]